MYKDCPYYAGDEDRHKCRKGGHCFFTGECDVGKKEDEDEGKVPE